MLLNWYIILKVIVHVLFVSSDTLSVTIYIFTIYTVLISGGGGGRSTTKQFSEGDAVYYIYYLLMKIKCKSKFGHFNMQLCRYMN